MFGRDKLDLVFFSFLNIAIAGQNSVAPRQNVIKNEIQLVMFITLCLHSAFTKVNINWLNPGTFAQCLYWLK